MDRLTLALVLSVAAWLYPATMQNSVVAQESTAQVVVERPLPGTSVSAQVQVSGWALDPSGPGTGIDAVHVYLDGEPGQPRSRFLGTASYGQSRPDVARTMGEERFTRSGFSLVTELPPGNHTLFVYAHSTGAGTQDGWSKAAVGAFEASSIAPVATMVQPGPAAAGDDGSYRTGQATWQGGRTCTRYNGAGGCESSVPYSVATGASCIQFNQRGQCTSYLPAEGGSSASAAPAATPTRSSGGGGGSLSVPTVGVARPASGPPPSAVRSAPADDGAAADDASAPAVVSAAPGRAPAALPAAPPPGISSAAPAAAPPGASAAATDSAPLVPRAVAPPPALAATPRPDTPPNVIQRSAPSPLDPVGDPPPNANRGPAPTIITLGPAEGPSDMGSRPSGAVANVEAPTAVPVAPQIVATQQALAATGGGSAAAGVGGLRSGCAMYIGCGPATPAPTYNSGSPLLAGGATGATGATTAATGSLGAGASQTAPTSGSLLIPNGATGAATGAVGAPAGVAGAAAYPLTPTPTACPIGLACGPLGR